MVGYLAVSGRLPFEAGNLPALIVRQATDTPPSVTSAHRDFLQPWPRRSTDASPATRTDRFPDGEAMAAALAPTPDARPALPPTLRAWLAARNPLLAPYMAWSAVFGTLTTVNLDVWLAGKRPDGPADILFLAAVAAAAAPADRRFPPQPGAPAVPRRAHSRRSPVGARDRAARAGRDRGGRSR